MTTKPTPQRIRLYSHMTQSAFLHVEDALDIGKLRLFVGTYKRGQQATQTSAHYLDLADARVLLAALARGTPEYQYREYKGTPLDGGKALSRVLTVKTKEDRVFWELTTGPGELTRTGAITPSRKSDPTLPRVQLTVAFSTHEAERLAREVLAYLATWDVCRMLACQQDRATFPPYPLSPGEALPDDAAAPPPALHHSLVAVTPPVLPEVCAQRLTQALFSGSHPLDSEPAWCYADESPVNHANSHEEAAYVRYLEQEGQAPPSRAALRQWLHTKAVQKSEAAAE